MNASDCAHFVYHAARMKLSAQYRVPYTVSLQLLLRCPFDCLYCSQDHQSAAHLPPDVVEGILRDVKTLGGRRIHLTGGEPTVYPEFAHVVRRARELGFFISVTTNGIAVEEQVEALRQVDQIQLSFDGPPEIRAQLCGEIGARVGRDAIKFMAREKLPFWTVTVLNRLNRAHVEWIVDHARRHGIVANFVLMERHPEDWNAARPMPQSAKALLPTPEENRESLRQLVALKRRGAPIGSSLPYLLELLEWQNDAALTSERPSRRYRCRAWQSQAEVLANGDLHTCDWTWQRGLGQSVLEHGFRHAWNRQPQPVGCRSCISGCYMESNLLFDLNPASVWNWGKRLLLGRQ